MRRDILLLTEMIEAAEQAQELTAGVSATELEEDRQRRDALLWNFTVLGEAAGQLSAEVKIRFPEVTWQQPVRLRTGSSTATGRSMLRSCTLPPASNSPGSSPTSGASSTLLTRALSTTASEPRPKSSAAG
jgi:hypothetical protein